MKSAIRILLPMMVLMLCSCTAVPDTAQSGTQPTAQTAVLPVPEDTAAAPTGDAEACIYFINVGKADSALIFAQGKYYLIDTGTKDSFPALSGALHDIGVEELEGVFITHTHSDHMGGLKKLAESFKVNMLYFADISEPNKDGEHKIMNRAEKNGLNYRALFVSDTVDGLFSVLGPVSYNADDDNDNSLVLMLYVCGVKALFTGDMQLSEEETLLQANTELKADILKVGNHGNPDATGEDFAAAVAPKYAVISTDTNEDTDSANPRVYGALNMAEVIVTQSAKMYIRFDILPTGAVCVSVH